MMAQSEIRDALDAVGIDPICEFVASGESLNAWCLKNSFAYNTVLNWIDADKERAANYARAREARADEVFESLDAVSEAAIMAETAVEVAGLRLKSDNIKWKLARMNAKYNDKIDVNANHSGNVGLTVQIVKFGGGDGN